MYFTILSNLTWFLCYLLGEQARIFFFVFKNSVKMKHEIIQLSFSYVILKPWFYYFKKRYLHATPKLYQRIYQKVETIRQNLVNKSKWLGLIKIFWLYSFQGPDVTWRQLMCKLLGHSSDSTIFYDNLLEMINERSGSVSRTNAMGKN